MLNRKGRNIDIADFGCWGLEGFSPAFKIFPAGPPLPGPMRSAHAEALNEIEDVDVREKSLRLWL